MTFEELMQQYGFMQVRDQLWRNSEAGLEVIEHSGYYEVEFEVDWTAHSLYPRTLEALQAILESVDPIPEPPKHKALKYEIEQSLGRVVIDRDSGVRGVITTARADGDRLLVDTTTDQGIITAVVQ